MNRMGASCSLTNCRKTSRKKQRDQFVSLEEMNEIRNITLTHHVLRHSVESEIPDENIASLYPIADNYVNEGSSGLRSPKSLLELSIDAVCRYLPDIDGELPQGIPQDLVDKILRSLVSHSALNATTLKMLRNCQLIELPLAGCRGVNDEWLTSLCLKRKGNMQEFKTTEMELDEDDNWDGGNQPSSSQSSSCSTSSFVSAVSTSRNYDSTNSKYDESTSHGIHIHHNITNEQTSGMNTFVDPFCTLEKERTRSVTNQMTLLDLRGSQRLTDKGLLQLGNMSMLTVAKFDNCHSLVGRGFVVLANCNHLHTLSLSNCRCLSDESMINIAHLVSIENLSLDGCRCLTNVALEAISELYQLRKLDLSQCDLITDVGLSCLHNLEELEELSIGWCRLITDQGIEILTSQPGRDKILKDLCLARCRITDNGVSHLAKLSSLEELDLNGCSSISSAALGETLKCLSNLKTLDVSYCPGILRSSWQGMIGSLKSLYLSYSTVKDVQLSRFSNLPSLEELNFDSCPIGDWSIAHLADNNVVPNLTSLDLADTDLTDLGMVHLKKFTKLTHLSLFYCNITDASLSHLSSVQTLETLNLDSRDIGDEGMFALRNLKNLKCLDVFSSRVTDTGCLHISRIKSLESLELCGGAVGDIGCIALSTLKKLTSLNLSQNERITNRGASALSVLTELKALNLSYTRVTSDVLRSLSALVHLQSLALYGCNGFGGQSNDETEAFQRKLPTLKCFRMKVQTDTDGTVSNGLDNDDDDSDSEMSYNFDESDVGASTVLNPDYLSTNESVGDDDSEFDDESIESLHDSD